MMQNCINQVLIQGNELKQAEMMNCQSPVANVSTPNMSTAASSAQPQNPMQTESAMITQAMA